MTVNGVTKCQAAEVSPERILLGKLALLSREGNHRAVALQLAEWWERECPDQGIGACGIRAPRRDRLSDPLTLPIVELKLWTRISAALENQCGVIYVRDLAKWPPRDLMQVKNMGENGVRCIVAALEEVGALKILTRDNRKWREQKSQFIG